MLSVKMETLLCVAEHKNFTRAAEELALEDNKKPCWLLQLPIHIFTSDGNSGSFSKIGGRNAGIRKQLDFL